MPSSKQRPAREQRLSLLILGYVAGYVDGCTFVALYGLFVAQVTGSFIFASAILTAREPMAPLKILAIPAFVLGAAGATVLNSISLHRKWRATALLLGMEALLLTAMLAVASLGPAVRDPDQPEALIVGILGLLAMGVQNASVRLEMRGAPSTNVMTTNTGQLAVDATELLMASLLPKVSSADSNSPDTADARRRLADTAPVVLAFLLGTISGTLACRRIGFLCLAAPAALVFGAAILAGRGRADERAD